MVKITAVYEGDLARLNGAILQALGNITQYERHRVELDIETPDSCGPISLQAKTLDDDTLAFRIWDGGPGQWKVGSLLDAINELANRPQCLALQKCPQ